MFPSIEIQLQTLPNNPGVYQFYDATDTLIYVGKAVNLKKRVSSYFQKEHDNAKTRILVRKIVRIEHIVVATESDALLLENNLIKKYQPRYNILLKDDKSYPWICVKKERFPRVFSTRRVVKDGSLYFGPYTSMKTVHTLLDLIKELFALRNCNYDLSPQNIANHKFKVCLEYHLKNCKGPCEGYQNEADYNQNIQQIVEILKGNFKDALHQFKEEMMALASEMRFEEAHLIKQKIQSLENYQAKSTIVSSKISNVYVFSIVSDEEYGYVNFLQVAYGAIVRAHTLEIKKKLEETDRELLEYAIIDIRERFFSNSKEIIVPFEMGWKMKEATFVIPQRGDKKHLLELSEMNGKQYKFDRLKQAEKLNPEQKQTRLMKELQEKLKLPKLPYQIECFDNSNISGTDAVAGCIVYKGMKPSRKDYRKYNIKTVEGPDDYASMQEVVRRRYSRMKEEHLPLPDLIITDGGKGQMDVVKEVVVDELQLDIPIAGLAKDDRHRTNELLYGFPPQTVGLDIKSELFKVLTQIQDEVHRFAITFHRDKRSKHALHSELDDIKGLGPKGKEALLKRLKTVKGIKDADYQEIVSILGQAKGTLVYKHFHPDSTTAE